MTLSPWLTQSVSLASPDGRLTATVEDPTEICMGGPGSGLLRFSKGFAIPGCSPSIVWSDDSRYLAVPLWAGDRTQLLLIVAPAARASIMDRHRYRVLQLDAFVSGVVTGTDSPKYQPAPVRVVVADLPANGWCRSPSIPARASRA